ncbi:MAG: hypothetical protein BGO63_03630 [Candidatus Accumulibacter sp. 66-26]|nr:MAG: hypothetical protein BGO63_03630 [Candidatus Accumulibacter sp. 66-26]
MQDNQRIARDQVFLVQSQRVDAAGVATGEVVQKVLVARDEQALYRFFSEQGMEEGNPLGWASLKAYEDAANLIRAALKGDAAVPVLVLSA